MADILYHAVPGDWRREQKYAWLDEVGHVGNVPWTTPTPDKQNNWLTGGLEAGFANFLPIGSKEAKADPTANISVVFSTYSRGLTTSRDDWMFAFDCAELAIKANRLSATIIWKSPDTGKQIALREWQILLQQARPR